MSAKSGNCPPKKGFDRFKILPGVVGNFIELHFFGKSEQQDLAIAFRQVLKRSLEEDPLLQGLRSASRRLSDGFRKRREPGFLFAGAPAVVLSHFMVGQRAKPGSKFGISTEGGKGFHCGEKYLLSDVLHVVFRDHVSHPVVDPGEVAEVKDIERLSVSIPEVLDEKLVAEVMGGSLVILHIFSRHGRQKWVAQFCIFSNYYNIIKAELRDFIFNAVRL